MNAVVHDKSILEGDEMDELTANVPRIKAMHSYDEAAATAEDEPPL